MWRIKTLNGFIPSALVLSMLLSFEGSLGGAWGAPQGGICPEQPSPLVLREQSGRYLTPVFDQVSLDKDLFFGEVVNSGGQREKLLLDVYAPALDRADLRPVLLMIHGGGFRNGTKEQGYIVSLAQAMARRGYVCVAVNYRQRASPQLDWKGTLKDCLEDVQLGLNWIRSNADARRIDRNHIAVVGGSAGGMIAVNFVAGKSAASPAGNRHGIFALVNLWGSPYRQELTPAGIDPCYPPVLIIHGTKDESVPFRASEELATRLKSAGIRNVLLPLPDAPHTPLMHMEKIIAGITTFLYESLTGGRQPDSRYFRE